MMHIAHRRHKKREAKGEGVHRSHLMAAGCRRETNCLTTGESRVLQYDGAASGSTPSLRN
eukprot:1109724-Prymnesium_polylepis.1